MSRLPVIEITVSRENNRIYRGFFSPAFPNNKNLDEAFYESGGEVAGLIGKLTLWEKIKDGWFQQILVWNKMKYKITGIYVPGSHFYPTAPMFLEAYKAATDANGKREK